MWDFDIDDATNLEQVEVSQIGAHATLTSQVKKFMFKIKKIRKNS